jgi:hypothetical protein
VPAAATERAAAGRGVERTRFCVAEAVLVVLGSMFQRRLSLRSMQDNNLHMVVTQNVFVKQVRPPGTLFLGRLLCSTSLRRMPCMRQPTRRMQEMRHESLQRGAAQARALGNHRARC